MKYTIQDFIDIKSNGFDIHLPEETLELINKIALKVGSENYIKTPIFHKKEQQDVGGLGGKRKPLPLRNNNNTTQSQVDQPNWNRNKISPPLPSFQIKKREGVEAKMDLIRLSLNKITDKTYNDQIGKIVEILNDLDELEDMPRISTMIFEIASNNRFYSKLYADFYSTLIEKYDSMRIVVEEHVNSFLLMFHEIEYVNPEEDYNKFCQMNKINEHRKAMSLFLVNLTLNNILSTNKLSDLLSHLITQVLQFIKENNQTDKVNEIIENIAILYNKKIFNNNFRVEGGSSSFIETMKELTTTKTTYASLSKKSKFKLMDLLEK